MAKPLVGWFNSGLWISPQVGPRTSPRRDTIHSEPRRERKRRKRRKRRREGEEEEKRKEEKKKKKKGKEEGGRSEWPGIGGRGSGRWPRLPEGRKTRKKEREKRKKKKQRKGEERVERQRELERSGSGGSAREPPMMVQPRRRPSEWIQEDPRLESRNRGRQLREGGGGRRRKEDAADGGVWSPVAAGNRLRVPNWYQEPTTVTPKTHSTGKLGKDTYPRRSSGTATAQERPTTAVRSELKHKVQKQGTAAGGRRGERGEEREKRSGGRVLGRQEPMA